MSTLPQVLESVGTRRRRVAHATLRPPDAAGSPDPSLPELRDGAAAPAGDGQAGPVQTQDDAKVRAQRTFRRRERRYLVADASAIRASLLTVGELRSYRVTTVYLDTAVPTWSAKQAAQCAVKFRLRHYDEELAQWLETKRRRRDGITVKRRQLVDRVPLGLSEIAWVTYQREAFEVGRCRVTIDTGVEALGKRLPFVVVEVKTTSGAKVPGWLRPALPSRVKKWSKARWALGRTA